MNAAATADVHVENSAAIEVPQRRKCPPRGRCPAERDRLAPRHPLGYRRFTWRRQNARAPRGFHMSEQPTTSDAANHRTAPTTERKMFVRLAMLAAAVLFV